MIRFLYITLLILTSIKVFSQKKYEPQILVLSPHSVIADRSLEKEIAEINKNFSEQRGQSNDAVDTDGADENIKKIEESAVAYAKTMDFGGTISFISHQYLCYRFFEHFPDLLVLLKDVKSKGDISDLRGISTREHLQYVLNFPLASFYSKNGQNYVTIRVQLYDKIKDAIVLDKEYEGDWNNPGFEFSCSDSSFNCNISNALSSALPDVIKVIAGASPKLINDRKIAQNRYDVLMNDFFSKSYNKNFLKNIIPVSDSNINIDNLYQLLVNDNKTKFVAFFLDHSKTRTMDNAEGTKKDQVINIISSKDDALENYAYVVRGLQYKDSWYYQKEAVSYFSTDDIEDGRKEFFAMLQEWNFFKEGSSDFSPEFWESGSFAKIKDRKKDPDWEKYKLMWENEERENRGYIGMPEIVADDWRQAKQKENQLLDSLVSKDILVPAYKKQIKDHPDNFSAYNTMYDKLVLIYPEQRDVLINPVRITDGQGGNTIRYYVVLKGKKDVYEWTYFPRKQLKEDAWHFGSDVVDMMETITRWNFSFQTLEDESFWNEYVTKKNGKDYIYLKKLK